jgi:hypothetical protein
MEHKKFMNINVSYAQIIRISIITSENVQLHFLTILLLNINNLQG